MHNQLNRWNRDSTTTYKLTQSLQLTKVLTNRREYKLSALEMLKWRGNAKLKESIQYKRIKCELYVHFYI